MPMIMRSVSTSFFIITLCLISSSNGTVSAAGPRSEAPANCALYKIPTDLKQKGFIFAQERIPAHRDDIRRRLEFQINFLLLDARSVLTDWLQRLPRYSWIFSEIFKDEGTPEEFIFLAPVITGLDPRRSPPDDGVGIWNIKGLCSKKKDGVELTKSKWHDDRQDLELSTRCFASRIRDLKSTLGSWQLAAAAYISSESAIKDLMESWKAESIWDVPLPDETEELLCRWIALAIITGRSEEFGLKYKPFEPLSYDEVSGLKLKKDLPVSEISLALGVSPLYVMDLNPKIKVAEGKLPAKNRRGIIEHKLATPKGRGWKLVKYLKRNGYLAKKK